MSAMVVGTKALVHMRMLPCTLALQVHVCAVMHESCTIIAVSSTAGGSRDWRKWAAHKAPQTTWV
jgi:hypothetical protein